MFSWISPYLKTVNKPTHTKNHPDISRKMTRFLELLKIVNVSYNIRIKLKKLPSKSLPTDCLSCQEVEDKSIWHENEMAASLIQSESQSVH